MIELLWMIPPRASEESGCQLKLGDMVVAQGKKLDMLMKRWANKFSNEQEEEQEAPSEGGCEWHTVVLRERLAVVIGSQCEHRVSTKGDGVPCWRQTRCPQCSLRPGKPWV